MNDQPTQLIVSHHDLSFNERGPRAEPGRALVYATKDGRTQVRTRRVIPGASGFTFHRVYVVDVSDHDCELRVELPSLEVPFQFQVELQLGWRVTDPLQIVDRRIDDGTRIVRSRLLDRLRTVAGQFSLEDVLRAEERINQQFQQGLSLQEGIAVYYFSARVYLDEATTQYLEAKRRKVREHVLATMDQSHEQELHDKRRAAIQAAVGGEDDLLLRHLAEHPGDEMTVVQHLSNRQEMAARAKRELFDKMVAQGFIQEADIDPLRQLLLQSDPQLAAPTQVFAAPAQIVGLPVPEPIAPMAAPRYEPPADPPSPSPPDKVYYDVRAEPADGPKAGKPPLTQVNGVVTWTSRHPRRRR